ncbi:hypothetical protein LSH36_75g02038 [Paralvinella palmiformis]|uniref:Dynactin subunit 1 n=1 Tax=Paralvinella palmiformis TaxID=53620 RepID=A0AAD9K2E8_9ANNE|nr:hypothetical protein LSH36_75g02038 [Paralvinella palmiformis]
MADSKPVKAGSRVEVIGKGIVGTVAFVGGTKFSTGKWIGVVLDEPKGKNNGTVQGKSYFSCPDNYGIFVRQSQITELNGDDIDVSSNVISNVKVVEGGHKKPPKPPTGSGKSSSGSKPSTLRRDKSGQSSQSNRKKISKLRSSSDDHPQRCSSSSSLSSTKTDDDHVEVSEPVRHDQAGVDFHRSKEQEMAPSREHSPNIVQLHDDVTGESYTPEVFSQLEPPLDLSGVSSGFCFLFFPHPVQLSVLEEGRGGSSASGTSTTPLAPIKLPTAGSAEDLSKQKKLNRLSMSGLRPPSNRTGADTASSTPKSKESSPAVSREATPPTTKPAPPEKTSQETPQAHTRMREPKAKEPKTSSSEPQLKTKLGTMSDISAMSASITSQMITLENEQEMANMKDEVRDLEEKLETLRVKRAEDKSRMKELEKLKIQLQQLQEYKSKMQEVQADLQRQLQASKKETKDLMDEFDRYREEMSDLAETVEMATLDKEMAEEKADCLQQEVDSLKEKLEEVTLDLQILKEDMEPAMIGVNRAVESRSLLLWVINLCIQQSNSSIQASFPKKNISEDTSGGATNYQLKQLEQQNERLKEALVKVRDLTSQDKKENQRIQKELEQLQSEVNGMNRNKERLEKEVGQLQQEVLELKEQVDAAQGSEDMVLQLTEKTLQQEDKIRELEEERADLEALCDMNDEIQENAREAELELREELDMANCRAMEAQRRLEAMQESIADYETTIVKFKELVSQLQESNRELRNQQMMSAEVKSQPTPTIDVFDFKTKFAETKATAKAIDMELRKLEVQQSNKHVAFLSAFMPESFMQHGGDHDTVLVLLLIPRLIAKTELLISQTKDKVSGSLDGNHDGVDRVIRNRLNKVLVGFNTGPKVTAEYAFLALMPPHHNANFQPGPKVGIKFDVPGTIDKEAVLKTHKSDAYSFANKFIHQLCILQATLKQYESALNTCSTDLLLKIGTLLSELDNREKSIDMFIELLRNDQLDETVNLEPLQKAISFFQHLYSVHLANEKLNCTNFMADNVRILLAACDCIHIDTARLKLILQPGHETSDISIALRDVENYTNEIRVNARKIKRHIPREQKGVAAMPLSFGKDVQENLSKCVSMMSDVVQVLQELASSALQQTILLSEDHGLPAKDLENLAVESFSKVSGKKGADAFNYLRSVCGTTSTTLTKISTAMENGEYDFDGTKEKHPVAPIVARIDAVKAQFADVEKIKYKLEAKDEDIRELKKQLKLKQEELSQQQVRMSLLEKKLENTNKDCDDKIEKIQQKLDEATVMAKKKEKEFEETLDALQSDIDTLEAEKAELKERLKVLSKKSLLENLSRQSSQSGVLAATLGVKDSPILLQENEALREALQQMAREKRRLMYNSMKEKLDKLPVLRVPKWSSRLGGQGTQSEPDVDEQKYKKLYKETDDLLQTLYKLCASPKVVDISKRKPGRVPPSNSLTPRAQLELRAGQLAALNSKLKELFVRLTETWIREHLHAEVNIEGYSLFGQDQQRNKKKGRVSGGVAFYIRNDIAVNTQTALQYTDGISDILGLYIKTKKLLIINLYRQPNDKAGSHRLMDVEFRNALGIIAAILTSFKSPTSDIILTWDFTLSHAIWLSGDTRTGATSDEQAMIEDLKDLARGCVNYKSNADHVEDPQTDMTVLVSVLEKLNFFSDQTVWLGMNSDLALINWKRNHGKSQNRIPRDRTILMRKRPKLNQQLFGCSSDAWKNKLMREATEIEKKLKMSYHND